MAVTGAYYVFLKYAKLWEIGRVGTGAIASGDKRDSGATADPESRER